MKRKSANAPRRVLSLKRSKFMYVLLWMLIVIAGMAILHMRYPLNFDIPNFYAEDGAVYVENVLDKGWLAALFTPFNGYLVIFQYGVVCLGMLINTVAGSGFDTIPKALSVASYFSISVICTLPWVLFRRRIGSIWAGIMILFLLSVPLGSSDFTVIGTIGNLKFAFFFAAFLLVLYRIDSELCPEGSGRMHLVDFLLLLCLLTNILVIALLPFILYRYWTYAKDLITRKSVQKALHNRGLISLCVLGFVSIVYVLIVYISGIPEMKGYLDGPLHLRGLINALYRSSWYGVFYPIYTTMNLAAVIGLLMLTPTILLIKRHRVASVLGLWAIFVSTVGFVFNRPGVTEFFMQYSADGGPGQFFYGATMIFIFLVFYLSADWFNAQKIKSKILTILIIAIYAVWAIPFAGDGTKNYARYSMRPTITQAIEQACRDQRNGNRVVIEIYPSPGWQMDVDRRVACEQL